MSKPTLILSLFLLCLTLVQAALNPDLEALVAFKSESDRLSSWNSTTDHCTWFGVFCLRGRVWRLVLEEMDLSGSFEPLTGLTQLRILSLKRNRLSGSLPDLSGLTALKLLFLSYNDFSGEFPSSVTSLERLYRLDLAFNNFSGEIPLSVNGLTNLMTLRLEGNGFSGSISGLNLPDLQEFNVSGNRFSGEIPNLFSGFPKSGFVENPSLCGSPIQKCNGVVTDPTRPGYDGAIATPLRPGSPSVIVSSPSSMSTNNDSTKSEKPHRNGGRGKISTAALVAIIIGDVMILAVVSLILYCYFWRNYAAKMRDGAKRSKVEKIVYSASPYPAQPGFERGRMTFFEGVKRFELEDLLRASAEMLGKGGLGTAYKAVLEDGNAVAVKRLKDAQVGGKREFEQHMQVLGRLTHPNLVSLKAYYFATEEKLLVCDYMPNGSLFWLLHGNRGPGRTPLDWTSRLRIAAGAARGLAFIHSSCRSLRLTHGNIKSANILLDKSGEARVSDFGLTAFAASNAGSARANGYRAPESVDPRKMTQKSDVYSFGVLLLELLTGKSPSVVDHGGPESGYSGAVDLPRWVQSVVREEWTAEVFDLELMRYKDIEEEMVSLLQIAMSCCSAPQDQRPKMGHVVKMIDEIRGVDASPSHDTADSVSDSPAVSDDNTCGTQQ